MSAEESHFRYLFGPVASRRLGRSLGIDLTPSKTCSFNCIYCQLGHTNHLTAERREWVPTAEVLEEIDRWCDEGGEADVMTLAGSGEPTLHTDFGRVLDHAHERAGLRSALLTNGSLLYLPEVRRDAGRASIAKVTMSAADEATWRHLHRPCEGIAFDDYVDGLVRFGAERGGELWLEVMLVTGLNDSPAHLEKLAEIVGRANANRVQLNTVIRPPAEKGVGPVPEARMEDICRMFPGEVEIIGRYKGPEVHSGKLSEEAIIGLVSRHPASAPQMARLFKTSAERAGAMADDMVSRGRLEREDAGGEGYYRTPIGE